MIQMLVYGKINGTTRVLETHAPPLTRRSEFSRGGLMPTLLIPLTQGKFALIDEQDADLVVPFKWCANQIGNTFYAVRNSPRVDGKRTTILMHRVILNAPPGMGVDHINGNGSDNRRQNIRICTTSQNMSNQRTREGFTSQFKGVCWDKHRNKWRACIRTDGKTIHIGYFIEETEAAVAYDASARDLFGEFARLNFGDAL